jgi:branched-chain amino acid transport system ATP-binding protein
MTERNGEPVDESQRVLTVENLTVQYGGVPAVDGISFTVDAGELVGIIGPNGAGKSSTLLALVNAVRSTSSRLELLGLSIAGKAPERVARHGLALVPEGHHIFGELSVADNLKLGRVARRSMAGLDEDTEWILSLFPILREFHSRSAGLLSGGQQQQLAIARALISSPRLLVLDEPSLGLSPTAVDTVFSAIAAVRQRGMAVMLVEQRAQQAVAAADRTHVLSEGRITMTLSPPDASNSELLTKAYLGS